MKQVVIETRVGDSVKVETSYGFDSDLVGKKQWEEVVIGNVTKYWVSVPDPEIKPIVSKEYKRKISEKFHLIAAKRERLKRYAAMVEAGGEIVPTDEDIQQATQLATLKNRGVDARRLKKIIISVPAEIDVPRTKEIPMFKSFEDNKAGQEWSKGLQFK